MDASAKIGKSVFKMNKTVAKISRTQANTKIKTAKASKIAKSEMDKRGAKNSRLVCNSS